MYGGKDEGFCLNYWRLSYRRKFIRTLWITPVVLALFAASMADDMSDWTTGGWIFAGGLLLLIALGTYLQARYNHKKWKRGPPPG